jgi:hypothetical protein
MWFRLFVVITSCALAGWVRAEPPALLTKAVDHWAEGHQELAFTQRTRVPKEDGTTHYERVERYDPSQPDDRRWQLLTVNRRPPTDEERKDIEVKRNRKPRKPAGNPPAHYLDMESARLVSETAEFAHFELGIKPEAARFVPLDKVVVRITVEKSTATIDHISAFLREPMRIAFGLAKILDVDVDLQFTDPATGPPPASEVASNSTARVKMSKFGDPLEFTWSDFKEVPAYR